jgi:glycerol uptake facilitator-like aquaporin
MTSETNVLPWVQENVEDVQRYWLEEVVGAFLFQLMAGVLGALLIYFAAHQKQQQRSREQQPLGMDRWRYSLALNRL